MVPNVEPRLYTTVSLTLAPEVRKMSVLVIDVQLTPPVELHVMVYSSEFAPVF
jgi:hypothetical protein